MVVLGIVEAKARFAELVERAAGGEEVVITRRGRPVARLERIDTSGAIAAKTEEPGPSG